MNYKYNLSIIERAFEQCLLYDRGDYTCCALTENGGNHERHFYEQIFEIINGESFMGKVMRDFNCGKPTDEEMKELRLMALSFLYEICRLKNNKKSAGF